MKKILYAILPIALAFALAAGAAFAAWQFESAGKSESAVLDVRDDIFENYDIKKADDTQVNKIKTYEIYLYPSTLYLNDYLDYLDGTKGAVLPEAKYGYIEPALGSDGKVAYTVHGSGGDTAYLNAVKNNDTYVMANSYTNATIDDIYYSVYKNDSVWGARDYLYGDPELDLNRQVKYSNITDEQHNWRNLHYYDRFGYWAPLAKDSGRYLPVKITVDENFSNTYYNNVVMTPLSDMGDPHDWYVYSFSCWAYVDNTQSPYVAPYYATDAFAKANSKTNYVNSDGTANPSLGSFCPTSVSQYFDIIESFEKYADEDGIIRLFPKFSNGKGYSAGSIDDGGGDAIKVVPEKKDENGNKTEMSALDQHELYMFYSTETGSFTSRGTTVTVRVSVLPNVDLNGYYSLDFMFAIAEYVAGWPGGWTDICSLYRDSTSGSNVKIDEILDSYGFGMYNLYLFVTQVASGTSTRSYVTNLETIRKNLVNKSDTTNFPSLFGKNLLPISSVFAGGKSFMLVAEKVREAKFIGDVNFGNVNYTTDEQLTEKYLSTDKSFRLINKELYGYATDSDGNSVKEPDAINSQFPYCYILQNVDFTEATTQYCQIRFQRYYRSDLHFVPPENYKYDRIEFSGVIYEQGFGNYFKLVDATVHSDGGDSTQQVIQLDGEEMRGVYDIILVFRSARESDASSPYAYNIGLYAYRHTNIFLKIYESDRTGKINYYQGSDGATTNPDNAIDGKVYEFVDHSETPLFVKSYPIGVSIKNTDKCDGGAKNSIGTELAACVNKAVSGDPTNIKLFDHVTGAEVAHYEKRTDVSSSADGFYLG